MTIDQLISQALANLKALDVTGALRALEQASALGTVRDLNLIWGMYYVQTRRLEDARRSLQTEVRLYPENEIARDLLQQVESDLAPAASPTIEVSKVPPARPLDAGTKNLAWRLRRAVSHHDVKARVLSIISKLTPDYWLERDLERYSKDGKNRVFWFEQIPCLNWIGHHLKPKNYLEVGVRRGRSMAQIATESPDTKLFGFDMWIQDYGLQAAQGTSSNPGPTFVAEELRRVGGRSVPTFTNGDSRDTLPAFFADPRNPQEFDLITIDGDHTYEGAKRDLEIAFQRLAPGGIIMFDDIYHHAHMELRALWAEFEARHPEFLFVEDHYHTGTAMAIKPPFTKLEAALDLAEERKASAGTSKKMRVLMPYSVKRDSEQATLPESIKLTLEAYYGDQIEVLACGPGNQIDIADGADFYQRVAAVVAELKIDLLLDVEDSTDSSAVMSRRYPTGLAIPKVYWAVDTHKNLDAQRQKAAHFDLVYAAQKNAVQHFGPKGKWLPVGASIHDVDFSRERTIDVGFIGTGGAGDQRQKQVIERLQREFPGFKFAPNVVRVEKSEIASRMKIVVNVSHDNDIDAIVFEAMACGAMLLTERIRGNGLEDLFTDGRHLVTFDSVEDLVAKVRHYLAHEEERKAIARAGQDHVNGTLRHHWLLEKAITDFRALLHRDDAAKLPKSQSAAPPIHFFTIVLNGMPFLPHHIEQFRKLPFEWHWHIVEGAASLTHDTAWSVSNGGQLPLGVHRGGLSVDGTTEYLDALKRDFPERISIWRNPGGRIWDGKVEMVRAATSGVAEPCLLWQVDSDELWTADQIGRMRSKFVDDATRHAAYFHCDYFVGPSKYVASMNTWATKPTDWLRVWRFTPGNTWESHEPPVLKNSAGVNVASMNPFTRDETKAEGITFQHFAYTVKSQVQFKESYYGYKDAVQHWTRLNQSSGRVNPADYLPWAEKDSYVEDWAPSKGELLGTRWLGGATVAASYSSMSVNSATQFDAELRRVFERIRPGSIIETGTYLGRGTSTIIWRALNDLGIKADFTTIEVNPEHHRQATEYFAASGMKINALLGLSVPRALLPSPKEIFDKFVQHREHEGIYYDHDEADRARLYFGETNFDVPEDLLAVAMRKYNYRPDFVLLDSAGHMGFAEFEYFMSMVKGPCHLMLDDIYHCKHYKTLQQVKADPRFEILVESKEKFGFCILRYTPDAIRDDASKRTGKAEAKRPAADDPKSILWVRTDSIGDNVMAAGMLEPVKAAYPGAKLTVLCREHIAELYRSCPFVDEIISFDSQALAENQEYRDRFMANLQERRFELVLNSVFSREVMTDFIALGSGGKRLVALAGNDSNMPEVLRLKHNQMYDLVIDSAAEARPEFERHHDFLRGLGIQVDSLEPRVWTSAEDDARAAEIFRSKGFTPERTIVIFAASQWNVKDYPSLGEGLRGLVQEMGFSVIAVGSQKERDLNQQALDAIGAPSLNLCGSLTLNETAAVVRRSRLAVGVDTSIPHIATAVGTECVVILGGGQFGRFQPYSALTSVVCLPLDCYDCNWRCVHATPRCIRSIAPSVLEDAVRGTLASRSSKSRLFVQAATTWVGAPEWAPFGFRMDPATIEIIPVGPRNQSKSSPLASCVSF